MSDKLSKISGIAGLKAAQPIGATLQIGIKKGFQARGFPDQKDRFHITTVREVDNVKQHHPSFALFNTAPTNFRQSVRGVLVHSSIEQCFEHALSMQTFPKSYQGPRSHPQKLPVCRGNGEQAVRWDGNDFQNISCPGRMCEFQDDNCRACKPLSRFVFSIRWPEGSKFEKLSTPLVKFSTGAYGTTANLLGFFEYIDEAAKSLGAHQYSLFGMPFTLTLTFRTNAEKRSRYPVVTISPDSDVFSFLLNQQEKMNMIKHEALTDESQNTPEVIHGDVVSISGPVEGM